MGTTSTAHHAPSDTDAAIARVEAKITHIRAIKRLEWRIWQVRDWADSETVRLEKKLAEARDAYERFQAGDALRQAVQP
jgi:hypothetical protein